MCYLTKERKKEVCDKDFLFNMVKQCGTNLICRGLIAPVIYTAVKNHGHEGYNIGQRKAKYCKRCTYYYVFFGKKSVGMSCL